MAKRKKYPKPTVKIEWLTVTMANDLLKTCDNENLHRGISRLHVQRYSDAVVRKQWMFSGESVIIDWYGNIVDGSHRCETVLKTKKPIQVVVVRGVDPKVFKVIDVGKHRSLADTLHSVKEQYSVELSAALIMLDAYKHNQIMEGKRNDFQNEDVLVLLKANPGLRESLRFGAHLKQRHLLSTGIGTFMHYILAKKNKKAADKFFNSLCDGINLGCNSPILRLRECLQDNKHRQIRFRRKDKIARVIKAWNAYRRSIPMTAITWRDSRNPKEKMPIVLG